VWLPRVESGQIDIERVERGGRPLQAAGIQQRIMELLTSVGTPRVYGSVTPRKIAERVKLGESVAPGESLPAAQRGSAAQAGPLLGIRASEVLESFFRDIAPPRLESSSVLRKGIARGVTEGTFAYTSGSQPTLGQDGKFQVNRDKVVIGRTLAEDEVDFDSGFLMVPGAVPEVQSQAATAATTPWDHTFASDASGHAIIGEDSALPKPAAAVDRGEKTVRLKFRATRDQVFKAFPAIANLTDKSDERKVTITVEGYCSDGFDPSWLRNAVDEPLDEANIEKLPDDR
jgi:hypothetical protein